MQNAPDPRRSAYPSAHPRAEQLLGSGTIQRPRGLPARHVYFTLLSLPIPTTAHRQPTEHISPFLHAQCRAVHLFTLKIQDHDNPQKSTAHQLTQDIAHPDRVRIKVRGEISLIRASPEIRTSREISLIRGPPARLPSAASARLGWFSVAPRGLPPLPSFFANGCESFKKIEGLI